MKQTAKAKKTPVRRCVGCSESFDKSELIRVVRTPEGEICLDFTGKQSGRGAYLCKSSECFKKARKQGRLSKNLDCAVPDEVLDALEKIIIEKENEQ